MVLNYSRGLAEEFAGWKDLAVSYSTCVCVCILYDLSRDRRWLKTCGFLETGHWVSSAVGCKQDLAAIKSSFVSNMM